MTTTSRPRRFVAVLVTLGALSVAGCSGGDEPAPDADSSSSPTVELSEPTDAPTLEVEPVTKSGSIVGRLPKKDRTRVEGAVSDIAVRFLNAAYLAGNYPRVGFRNSYPGFTGGAAQVARKDLTLLTNKPIGDKVDEITATGIGVKVDLLVVGKRAVAATARVELGFRTAGKIQRRFRVQGRLLMTKQNGNWKIFAYDLSKGSR